MTQELLLREMLAEMRKCITREDARAGLPYDAGMTYDIDHIFVLWQQFRVKIENLCKYIRNLDDEIAARIPWGDITSASEEGFKAGVPVTRFWTAQKDCFEANYPMWKRDFAANLISEGEYLSFFTTSTDYNTTIFMEGAEEAKVCPSPTSTLIMLQTRAKDTLKFEELKRTDFAVAHYLEVEKALGLKDTIRYSKRKRFFRRIRKIFHHK